MAVSTYFNRVKYTVVSAGTVDFVTSAAVSGFLTPATASIPNASVVSYVAFSSNQSEWETGQGTYTSATATLARTTVRESSNAGAKTNFTAAPTVALDLQAQDIATLAPLVSPSFTTPTLGVATGTSLALGGAAIGTNALAVTGTSVLSGNMVFGTAPFIGWGASFTADATISRNAAGVIQFGTTAANAAGSWSATNGTLSGTLFLGNGATSGNYIVAAGTTTFSTNSVVQGGWNSGGMYSRGLFLDYANADVSISRNAAGVLQIGTSSFNALGSWLAVNGTLTGTLDTTGPIRGSHGYTVATLPTAGTAGRMAYVTDALAPTFLATVVGGGAVITPVFDNGTNWIGA